MSEPNWDELRAIGAEASRLADATHRLLPGDYDRLLARAKIAIGNPKYSYLLEFIINRNPNPPRR